MYGTRVSLPCFRARLSACFSAPVSRLTVAAVVLQTASRRRKVRASTGLTGAPLGFLPHRGTLSVEVSMPHLAPLH